jgi:hypothetical protein
MDFGSMWWEGSEWICLAKDRGHWQALVSVVVNFQVL